MVAGAKKLVKNNFEYQKVHEEELLKSLEEKSIALRDNENELLAVRESFETVSKQLEKGILFLAPAKTKSIYKNESSDIRERLQVSSFFAMFLNTL